MIGLLKKAVVDLPISLTTNLKRISGNSLTPLGAQNKDIGTASSSLEKVLCKQLHVTAISSPVFLVVVEIVMRKIEEQALATYTRTIPLGYTTLTTTIYRKPTHTDRLLDQSSYNPTSHKATTIRTLTRLAQLVGNSPDSIQDETDYLNNVISKNNYSTNVVRRNTHSNTDSNTQTNVNSGPVTTATIPYIRGTSETIARILQPYNIRVAHKPITTLRQLLTIVKDKDKPEDWQGGVYKIKCCDCQATYID